MASGVSYGSTDFREQVAFFLGKVNQPTAAWDDVWLDQHDSSFMVAGAYKAQLLADLRDAVQRGIVDGTSIDEFRRDFAKIVETHGWSYNGGFGWRTRVIYDTNIRQSYNAGRYAQQTDPDMLAIRPYMTYHHRDGQQFPRPLHVSWDGLTLHYDHPWIQTHYPANGWGCECYMTSESRASIARKGLKISTDMASDMVEVTVGKSTGNPRTVITPAGVDPGFGYAPGATRSAAIRDQLKISLTKLPASIGNKAIQALNTKPPAAPPAPKSDTPNPQSLDEYIAEGKKILDELLPDIEDSDSPKWVILEALKQVRPVSKAVKVFSNDASATRLREASRLLPDDWTNRSDVAGNIVSKIISGRSVHKELGNGDSAILLRRSSGADTALHELMHRIQLVMPGLDALFQELHRKRTAGDPLLLLDPNDPVSFGRKDGYLLAYQGREYSFSNANGSAFEVITMGFQLVFGEELQAGDKAQMALINHDREMFELVLGTLWYYK